MAGADQSSGRPEAMGEHTPRVTQPLGAITDTGPSPMGPAEGDARELDPGATVATEAVQPFSTSRPRRNTLAAAIRPRGADEQPSGPANTANIADSDELPSGVADESDEWAAADQPTVMLAPLASGPRERPAFLDTGEQPSWPPRPAAAARPDGARPDGADEAGAAEDKASSAPPASSAPSAARQPKQTRPIHPDVLGGPRYAAPDGKLMPVTPPGGVPRAVAPNPRMERIQALRRQRTAHEQGGRGPQDPAQVAEMVRQWWGDLRPGLQRALRYQHEARASGMYPVPAYAPTPISRLGDAFGKVAGVTRGLAGRAHAAAAPALKRLHDQAEQAAQALIDKLEGTPVQQQAPFLGPGRIAVLFRQGVTVGQAQRLLMSSQARPLRLIPRKHGFLALVPRGDEPEIAGRLRRHPYVRDVIYMEYDDPDDPSQSLSIEVPAMAAVRQGGAFG